MPLVRLMLLVSAAGRASCTLDEPPTAVYREALMKPTISIRRPTGRKLLVAVMALAGTLAVVTPAPPAVAAHPDSQFVYSFVGVPAVIPPPEVTNTAANNPTIKMKMSPGNWTSPNNGANGIDFNGAPNSSDDGTDDSTSVGYAKPTVAMTTTGSVGISARFTYQSVPAGTCGTPGQGVVNEITSNLAQIGRAVSTKSQIKLQISECSLGAPVFGGPKVGCRAAGINPPESGMGTTNNVRTHPLQLQPGVTYVARCVKGPDNGATAPLTVLVQPVGQAAVPLATPTIPATGEFSSDQHVSVGNRYGGPIYNDQFFGLVAKMAICKASTEATVTTCLDTEVPPSAGTGSTELVSNGSVEANLTGWNKSGAGTPSAPTLTRIAPAAPGGGTKSLRVNSNSAVGSVSNKVGFLANPRLEGSTVAGKVYTGSVQVKPGALGQIITLRVREMQGTGNLQVGSAATVSSNPNSTAWQPLSVPKTASGPNNSIHFEVYSENIAAGQVFNADLMSLLKQ